MWSCLGLTLLVLSTLAVGCTYQKSERVIMEIEAGKFDGHSECSTPVRFDVRNDLKTFILIGSKKRKNGANAPPQCIEILRKIAGKKTIEIHYGRQISSEVIVEHCNLSDFHTYSVDKGDKKGYFMALNFRCKEKDRNIELHSMEYLFALILACAALSAIITTVMHFCCGSEKKSQTAGVKSATVSQKPDPEGTDSSGPNNSSTPSYE